MRMCLCRTEAVLAMKISTRDMYMIAGFVYITAMEPLMNSRTWHGTVAGHSLEVPEGATVRARDFRLLSPFHLRLQILAVFRRV